MQILAVIQKHGFTLEQVAKELGITKGSLSATISAYPNVKKMIDIAKIVGCHPAEFFDDWYENEGKEQAWSTGHSKVHPAPSPADDLPFNEESPKQEPEQKSELTPDIAFICPHCHEAIKLGFVR